MSVRPSPFMSARKTVWVVSAKATRVAQFVECLEGAFGGFETLPAVRGIPDEGIIFGNYDGEPAVAGEVNTFHRGSRKSRLVAPGNGRNGSQLSSARKAKYPPSCGPLTTTCFSPARVKVFERQCTVIQSDTLGRGAMKRPRSKATLRVPVRSPRLCL